MENHLFELAIGLLVFLILFGWLMVWAGNRVFNTPNWIEYKNKLEAEATNSRYAVRVYEGRGWPYLKLFTSECKAQRFFAQRSPDSKEYLGKIPVVQGGENHTWRWWKFWQPRFHVVAADKSLSGHSAIAAVSNK